MRASWYAIVALVIVGCGGALPSRGEQSHREQVAARICGGIDDERSTRLVPAWVAVESVGALREERPDPRGVRPTETGASIVVRAERGLTSAWLDRVVSCRVARCVAGYDACRLGPTRVAVHAQGPHFVIDLRAEKRSDASALLDRAMELAP